MEIDPKDLPELFKQPRGWVGLATLDVRQMDEGDPECIRTGAWVICRCSRRNRVVWPSDDFTDCSKTWPMGAKHVPAAVKVVL